MAGRDNAFDMQIKLLMIGDSGVGKTCLLLRYANDSFSPTFITTIGIDFKIKNIQLDSKRIKLQVNSNNIHFNSYNFTEGGLMYNLHNYRRIIDMGHCWAGEI